MGFVKYNEKILQKKDNLGAEARRNWGKRKALLGIK